MSHKLEVGTEAVGHLEGFSEPDPAAYLKLDSRGAEISIPRVDMGLNMFREFAGDSEPRPAAHMRFQTSNGLLHLSDCSTAGGAASSRGFGVSKVRSRRVVDGGDLVEDYAEVDGMTSELDGLASWIGMSTVEQSIEWENDGVRAVILRAENQDDVVLGGSANATVESSFAHNPQPKGNVYGITDVALLRTRSDELWPWRKHSVVHHMFQDLMCLVYGRPCMSKAVSVKREDDQPYLQEGDHRRTWRNVYEPRFGRSAEGVAPLDRAKAKPLFGWEDTDPQRLRTWIDEWELWSRPTWISVTTMFQRGTTVESRLLQVGVALEALGYAIWIDSGGSGQTPKYPELLEFVTDAVSIEHNALFRELTPSQWRSAFNAAFKGSKHADNPLPDGREAIDLSAQGMNLIRCWLGRRLGVQDKTLRERLARQ